MTALDLEHSEETASSKKQMFKEHAVLPYYPKPPELNHLLLKNFLLQGRTGQWGKILRISNIFGNYVSKKHGTRENCCMSAKKNLWMLLQAANDNPDGEANQSKADLAEYVCSGCQSHVTAESYEYVKSPFLKIYNTIVIINHLYLR